MKEWIEEKHALSESIYMSGHGLDWKDCDDIAEQLYTEGYRKQSESVWSTSVIFDVPAQKIVNYGHVCQSCFYLYKSKRPRGHKLCPNCGAHMKGGAE